MLQNRFEREILLGLEVNRLVRAVLQRGHFLKQGIELALVQLVAGGILARDDRTQGTDQTRGQAERGVGRYDDPEQLGLDPRLEGLERDRCAVGIRSQRNRADQIHDAGIVCRPVHFPDISSMSGGPGHTKASATSRWIRVSTTPMEISPLSRRRMISTARNRVGFLSTLRSVLARLFP